MIFAKNGFQLKGSEMPYWAILREASTHVNCRYSSWTHSRLFIGGNPDKLNKQQAELQN